MDRAIAIDDHKITDQGPYIEAIIPCYDHNKKVLRLQGSSSCTIHVRKINKYIEEYKKLDQKALQEDITIHFVYVGERTPKPSNLTEQCCPGFSTSPNFKEAIDNLPVLLRDAITKDAVKMMKVWVPVFRAAAGTYILEPFITDCPFHIQKIREYMEKCQSIDLESQTAGRVMAFGETLEEPMYPDHKECMPGYKKENMVPCCKLWEAEPNCAKYIDVVVSKQLSAIAKAQGDSESSQKSQKVES